MATTPYPLPRSARRTAVLAGNGGASYGPFGDGWGIFDVEDVTVWRKDDGQGRFLPDPAVTITKTVPSAAYSTFSVTFDEAIPATTAFYAAGARRHEREAAITRGGAIASDALEKELSKQSVVLQEFARDIALLGEATIAAGGSLLQLDTFNPMEERFGAAGGGAVDDRNAVRAAGQALVDNGGGTLVLTRPHRITGGVLFTENVPIRVLFMGAGALICDFDEPDVALDFQLAWDSYKTPAPIIQDMRLRLAGNAPDGTCRGLRISYTSDGGDFGGGTGGPRIIRPRIRPTVGSRTWLHPIELIQAPHAMVFDPAIIGRGGKNATDRQGAGIALGNWAQGFMCLEGNIRGYAAGVRVSDQIDYDGDAPDFQAEGGTLNEVKIQSCDIAFDIDLADTEVAWRLINCNATANTFLRSRNITDWLVQGNAIQWGRRNAHQVDIILQRDDGDVNAPNGKSLRALVQGNKTKTSGDVNFDVTDIARGASTVITYLNTTSPRTIDSISIDPGDGSVTVIYIGTVGQGRNGRLIEISGATTPAELNGTWRMGDLDSVAGTFRLYQPDSAIAPESLVDGSDWSPSLTGTPIFVRLYSTGVIADGDVMWLDQITGTTALDQTPIIVADHDATAKTFTAKRYPGGEDIDTTGQPALAAIGRVTRHGCFIEVRGGRDVDIADNMIHARSLAVHAWPMAREIVVNDNKLNNAGSYNPRLLINESEDPATITVFGPDVQEDGLALPHYGGITFFERTIGSPGDGVRDDAPYWNDMLAAGKTVVLADATRKQYRLERPVLITVDGTGIVCRGGKALVALSGAAGHFDNDLRADRYSITTAGGKKFAVPFHATGRSGIFLRDIKIVHPWAEYRHVRGLRWEGCSDIGISGNTFTGFCRGAVISLAGIDGGKIEGNHIHDCYTKSEFLRDGVTLAESQDIQVTGISTDDDWSTEGCRDLVIARNRINDLTVSNAVLLSPEVRYQTDGINIQGNATKTKRSSRIIVSENIIDNVGDGIDNFGYGTIITNNQLTRCFNVFVKLTGGAASALVQGNSGREAGRCAVSVGGSSAAEAPHGWHIIDGNDFENINRSYQDDGTTALAWLESDGSTVYTPGAAGHTYWHNVYGGDTGGVLFGLASVGANRNPLACTVRDNRLALGGNAKFGVFVEAGASTDRLLHTIAGNEIAGFTQAKYQDAARRLHIAPGRVQRVQLDADYTLDGTANDQPLFNKPTPAGIFNTTGQKALRVRGQVQITGLSSTSGAWKCGFGGTASYQTGTMVNFNGKKNTPSSAANQQKATWLSGATIDVATANTNTQGQFDFEGTLLVGGTLGTAYTVIPLIAPGVAAACVIKAGSWIEIWEIEHPGAVNGDFA
jgi:hypothetical protein